MLRFTHPTPVGWCTRVIPIKKKGLKAWLRNQEMWSLFVRKDRTISLSPSIWCKEHDVHGMITNGKWNSFHHPLSDMSQIAVEGLIDHAIKRAEQFGGGYWGAILALADRPSYSNNP